ncbi:MAG: hypothetical protein HW412_1865 [Bacteroidetes bacterium]|nr:hypothetical protein [Bacteroidota bacterium]
MNAGKLLALFIVTLHSYSHQAVQASSRPQKPLSEYRFERLGEHESFPSTRVTAILQSRDGYLWFGTDMGLLKYDGVRLVTSTRLTTPALGSSLISALCEDRDGNIWVGTSGGGVTRLGINDSTRWTSQKGLASDYIRGICQDANGDIWIGTDGEGLSRITHDTVRTYKREQGLAHLNVTSLHADHTGDVWVGSEGGVQRIHQGRFESYTHGEGLPNNLILSIAEGGNSIWVGGRGGLSQIQSGTVTAYTLSSGFPMRGVRAVYCDPEGRVWCAGAGRIARVADSMFSSMALDDSTERINALLFDREGTLWIGTDTGVLTLRDESFSFLTTRNGIPPGEARPIFEDRAGRIWIATDGGLAHLYRGVTTSVGTAQAAFAPKVFSICEDGNGDVWFGTMFAGLHKFGGGRFVEANIPNVHQTAIWAIHTDREGTLWVGTGEGLYRISREGTEKFTGLSNEDVRAISEDAQGRLWIGTSYGLNRIENGKDTVFTTQHGLSNPIITVVYPDSSGDVWVGTFSGLNVYRNDSFIPLTATAGLPEDPIHQILEDDLGYLWLTTSGSLLRLRKKAADDFILGNTRAIPYESFDQSDGLMNQSFTGTYQPAGMKSRDGRLWFPTQAGVAVVDPEALRVNATAPQPIIEHIVVGTTLHSAQGPLSFAYGHDNYEFKFTAPSFVNPARLSFWYQLEGVNQQWVDAGTRRSAFYNDIPPGEHVFKVKAVNEDGVWSEREAFCLVTIQPAYWMTWWFRLLVGLAFLTAAAAAYRTSMSRVRRKHEEQQRFTRELLKAQEQERLRIARELHDGLGQNIILIKNKTLLAAQAADKQSTVANNLQDVSNLASSTLEDLRQIAHNLRPPHLERWGLADSIRSSLQTLSERSSVEFDVDIDTIGRTRFDVSFETTARVCQPFRIKIQMQRAKDSG